MKKSIESIFTTVIWVLWGKICFGLFDESKWNIMEGFLHIGKIFLIMLAISLSIVLAILVIKNQLNINMKINNVDFHETIQEINWNKKNIITAQSSKFVNLEFRGEGLASSITPGP